LVVQLQDPKLGYHDFDLVIAPEHDNLTLPHVLPLLGSTNRITPERLASEYAPWRERIEALPTPRIAILIGGRSKVYDLSEARAEALTRQVREAVGDTGGAILLSLSRRTPPEAQAVFERVLSDLPGIIYSGEGPNPYFAFMHAADHILVTEDSVNMATEAAGTGRPVHLLGMDRLRPSQKFDIFHKNLRMHGIARPFAGKLDGWTYIPLDETARAARHVLQIYSQKKVHS
jgi:mitochondrial fission protein ELM1